MSIDDPHSHAVVAADIVEESQRSTQEIMLRSGFTGVVSAIPVVGGTINAMLTELALKRVYERMQALMEDLGKRIEELGEEKINREWFRSEQFQTLLYEAISQLNTTHDRSKIEMLGTALANSGTYEMTDDSRKELFVRLLRDLTPQHIAVLLHLLPSTDRLEMVFPPETTPEERTRSEAYMKRHWWESRPEIVPSGADQLIAQMLSSFGLLEEGLRSGFKEPHIRLSSPQAAEQALRDILRELQKPPKQEFRISELGKDFLQFLGLPKANCTDEAKPSGGV